MKAFFALALVTVCVLALCNDAYAWPSDADKAKDVKEPAVASKDVKDAIKAAKDQKKTKKECAKDCGTAYDPVCAHDPANPSFKPRSFGTQCAMDVVNCEMGTKLVVKNKGECAGSTGTRLS